MPPVTRKGDLCSGHECFPPRNSTSGSQNVFVNGKAAHRQGDSWASHSCTHPNSPHGSHSSVLASGSKSVYVNSRQLGRISDPIACGSSVATGSENVYAGG